MRPAVTLIFLLALLGALAACRSDANDIIQEAEANWRKGDYFAAIRLNYQRVARDPHGKDGAQALLRIGNIYYWNLRQISDAVGVYQQVAADYPGSIEEYQARLLLAEIYASEIGDLTQAIAEYDKVLHMPAAENRAEIQFRRAEAYFKKEDFNRALRELQQIQEAGVGGHLADQVQRKIGNIYQIQKRYEEALAAFQKGARSSCVECRRRAILNLMDTYESLFDFENAIASVRRLGTSPEDMARIKQEVARLEDKRRRLGRAADAVADPRGPKQ